MRGGRDLLSRLERCLLLSPGVTAMATLARSVMLVAGCIQLHATLSSEGYTGVAPAAKPIKVSYKLMLEPMAPVTIAPASQLQYLLYMNTKTSRRVGNPRFCCPRLPTSRPPPPPRPSTPPIHPLTPSSCGSPFPPPPSLLRPASW